ncbi:MAG: hypothetical protein ACXVIF_07770, partial [Halobacteriota archaeon]
IFCFMIRIFMKPSKTCYFEMWLQAMRVYACRKGKIVVSIHIGGTRRGRPMEAIGRSYARNNPFN